MQIKSLLATVLFLISFKLYATDEPLIVPSSLKTVTIYRSGAELIHNTSAQLTRGNEELIIEGISNTIHRNSVQINCPAAVTIMGVEFSNNYLVTPEISARIKFLQDSIESVQKELDKITVQIQTTIDLLEVLKANRDI